MVYIDANMTGEDDGVGLVIPSKEEKEAIKEARKEARRESIRRASVLSGLVSVV